MMRSDSTKELQDKEWGLHLYTAEVDRLNGEVQALMQEVTSLRMKMAEMTNQ